MRFPGRVRLFNSLNFTVVVVISPFHCESQDCYSTSYLEVISDLWRTARSRIVETTTKTKQTPYTFYPDSLIVNILPHLCSLWGQIVFPALECPGHCVFYLLAWFSLQPRVASLHSRAEQYSALGTPSADFWGSVSPEIAPVLHSVLGMRALLVALNLRSGRLVGTAWVLSACAASGNFLQVVRECHRVRPLRCPSRSLLSFTV